MGNMQQQQADMAEKLKEITIQIEQDGVKVIGNASKAISDIQIEDALCNVERKEELQDLLMIAVDNFIKSADAEQEKMSQQILNNILPGGMGSIFGQ